MTVNTELFSNALGTTGVATLASDPSTGGTTLTLTTGHGARFPAVLAGQQMRLLLFDAGSNPPTNAEIVVVTAHTANADTMTVTRGQEGTSGVAHAALSEVRAVLSAESQRRWVNDYVWQPRHNKMLTWSFDPVLVGSATRQALIAGRPHYVRCPVPETMTLANALYFIGVVGATVVNGRIGVYNKAGTLIAQTAAQTTTWQSTGLKTTALVAEAGQSLTVPGGPDEYLYVALFVQSAGTLPQFARGHAETGLANAGQTAGTDPLRIALDVTTGQTSLPATKNFLSAAVGSDNPTFWVALS